MVDFVTMGKTVTYLMAYIPQLPKYDVGLFIRPFRGEGWLGIAMTFSVILCCLIICCFKSKITLRKESRRVAIFVGWMTYLGLSAYYQGALTMFFSTEIANKFTSRLDVLKAGVIIFILKAFFKVFSNKIYQIY